MAAGDHSLCSRRVGSTALPFSHQLEHRDGFQKLCKELNSVPDPGIWPPWKKEIGH